MEEVDNIIFHSLRMIGCNIDDDVQSLSQLTTDLVIEATIRCIQIITQTSLDLPMSLPPSMSARFRLGTSLATAVTELGYKGEIGYQTFLYSNEKDVRRVLMFLIEHLPKEAAEIAEENLGSSVLLQRQIANELRHRLNLSWTPSYCKYKGARWNQQAGRWHREGCSGIHPFCSCPITVPRGMGDLTTPVPKDVREYYIHTMKPPTEQPSHPHDIVASLLDKNMSDYTEQLAWEEEWNKQSLTSRLTKEEYIAKKKQAVHTKIHDAMRQSVQKTEQDNKADLASILSTLNQSGGGKTKGSRFTHTEKLQFAQSDEKAAEQLAEATSASEKELEAQREAELDQLKSDLGALTTELDSLSSDIAKYTAGHSQMTEELEAIKKSNEEKERSYRIKKQTFDLLPDADNNLAQLQNVVDSSSKRLVNLATQWESHRLPLIDEYRQLKESSKQKMSESQKKLDEIKDMRAKMKTFADTVKSKEELRKQLLIEFDQMTKDVNRSVYTQRIMEIVRNIKRQNDQIDKVLIDTRAIQKEINQLNGKLDRTFTVTDELIFKDAKRDESVRKAYKYLAALHENCDTLMKTVSETGELTREIRELEDQIDNMGNEKTAANLEKITADYQQMKNENAALVAKLKKR